MALRDKWVERNFRLAARIGFEQYKKPPNFKVNGNEFDGYLCGAVNRHLMESMVGI